jgi:phosphate transport system permease protein
MKMPGSDTTVLEKATTTKNDEKSSDAEVRLSVKSKPGRQITDDGSAEPEAAAPQRKSMVWDFKARGEPFLWLFGGGLCVGIAMIVSFVILIVYNGILTFYPRHIEVVQLRDGSHLAGEVARAENFRPGPEVLAKLSEKTRKEIADHDGFARRTLYHIGNFDLYNEDFKWVVDYEIAGTTTPEDMFFVERMEWGPFIGTIKSIDLNGKVIEKSSLSMEALNTEQTRAAGRRDRIREIERGGIASVNHYLEEERLKLKKVGLKFGQESPQYAEAEKETKANAEGLEVQYRDLAKEVEAIREKDAQYTITLADVNGRDKTIKLSDIVRLYPANKLTFTNKVGIYLSRWWEFLTQDPREANTEGGVMPAIFGTFCMTILMALLVAPFGVIAALYLREYAKQGRLVSLVRICVNNLAGVPSIVYGVFGLGFFAYILGGNIDRLFFPERLPTPTYGTGGLLWASLTLALLTVPVVIVATEEALAAVPQSMREGSLACGASKWQTIKYIVLPRAMPGIMTGLILAMARGAGEVAPLMLVGVVKLAPELPIDHFFPYIHLDRSFMHLGFHIFDVGFQSRNSEAAKPMVYVTTLLLISLVFAMNAASIMIRNRLKRKFFTGHF